jgi:hypothetical protein
MHDQDDNQEGKTTKMKTHGYDYIEKWGRYMGSSEEYIAAEIARAVQENAPKDAIYASHGSDGHKPEDGWRTADDVTNPQVRAFLGLPPAPVVQQTGGAAGKQTWRHADPDIQESAEYDPKTRVILFAVTREYVNDLVGREITDDEAARLVKAIPFSTIPDALSEVVSAVCGAVETEDDG